MTASTVEKKLKTTTTALESTSSDETTKVTAAEYKEALLAARDDIDKLLAENACGKLFFLFCFFWNTNRIVSYLNRIESYRIVSYEIRQQQEID
jgi:hypothetical protein